MGSTARAIPGPAGSDQPRLPFPVPAAVLRARRETDWTAYLPPRAAGASWTVGQWVKRGADIVLSLAALVMLSPLLLVLALLVRFTSDGPVFYQWRVLGQHARPFVGWKFRTMVANADALKAQLLEQNEMTGPAFKMRNDPRITAVGRWMRKFSLDELPQLWSVLRGDMSLVGPRPPSPEEFEHFSAWQRGKLAVKPGITCLWQVSGRSEITDFDEWMRLDRQYVQEWSLALDAKLLVRTIPAVMRGHGAY
jgi:lipopolysaccharide/colanic/teichoic acid biosynthesis glycosyltransferase